MIVIALVALVPTLVGGVRLKGDSAQHVEGHPAKGSNTSSGYLALADEDEDIGLVSAMLSQVAKDRKIIPTRRKRRNMRRAAVVAVGHIRTFILPGVHSSLQTNLLDTVPGAADFLFIGHRGKYVDSWAKGAENVSVTSYLNRFDGSEEKAAWFVLNKMMLRHAGETHVEIHAGSTCDDLTEARRQFGTTGPECDSETNGHLMQVLWLDHAFQQVDQFGQYDLIIRIRPDVAVWKPFPWTSLSTDAISYCDKRDMGFVDWTLSLPPEFLKESWPSIVERFVWQSRTPWNSPDIAWKNSPDDSFDNAVYVNYPTCVVRSADSANCHHVKDDSLYDDCLRISSNGYFMDEH
jgi:hypothetical protein